MDTLSLSELKPFFDDLVNDRHGARSKVVNRDIDLSKTAIPRTSANASTSYNNVSVVQKSDLANDELVSLADYGFKGNRDYYSFEAMQNPIYKENFIGATEQVLLRKGLAEKLSEMNDSLRNNYGLQFEPMNGFRPLSVQDAIFQVFCRDGLEKYGTKFSEEELKSKSLEHAKTYASTPPESVTLENPRSWYAHGTGAAIDMFLQDLSENRLEFGVAFDIPEEITGTRFYEDKELISNDSLYRENRRTLFWSMASAGFINYPEEFFHFDPLKVNGSTTQFAIHNGKSWGLTGIAKLKANVPPAKEALTE